MSVAERACRSLADRRDELAGAATEALYAEVPEMERRFGPAGRAKCLEDMRHNFEFLGPAVAFGAPSVFADYVRWLVRLLDAHGVGVTDVQLALAAMERVVETKLPADEAALVAPCFAAGLAATRVETT